MRHFAIHLKKGSIMPTPILRRNLLQSLAIIGVPAFAQAQDAKWPTKTIKIIVPYPAGGFPDALARQLGEQLTRVFATPVVVENRPGAAGVLGVRAMTSQPYDGHTLVLITSNHVTVTALSPNFDITRETQAVTRLVNSPLILVVNADSRYRSVGDLIKAVKEKPGELTYGSAGAGSTLHMAVEHLAELVSGFKALHVPYKATSEAVTAILGKSIEFSFGIPGAVLPLIMAGKLRALGVTAPTRMQQLADIPTISEAGVPGYKFGTWVGIAAHKEMPAPLIGQLHAALVQSCDSDGMKRLLQSTGSQLDLSESPVAFSASMAAEIAKERMTVKRLGLTLQS